MPFLFIGEFRILSLHRLCTIEESDICIDSLEADLFDEFMTVNEKGIKAGAKIWIIGEAVKE